MALFGRQLAFWRTSSPPQPFEEQPAGEGLFDVVHYLGRDGCNKERTTSYGVVFKILYDGGNETAFLRTTIPRCLDERTRARAPLFTEGSDVCAGC